GSCKESGDHRWWRVRGLARENAGWVALQEANLLCGARSVGAGANVCEVRKPCHEGSDVIVNIAALASERGRVRQTPTRWPLAASAAMNPSDQCGMVDTLRRSRDEESKAAVRDDPRVALRRSAPERRSRRPVGGGADSPGRRREKLWR